MLQFKINIHVNLHFYIKAHTYVILHEVLYILITKIEDIKKRYVISCQAVEYATVQIIFQS